MALRAVSSALRGNAGRRIIFGKLCSADSRLVDVGRTFFRVDFVNRPYSTQLPIASGCTAPISNSPAVEDLLRFTPGSTGNYSTIRDQYTRNLSSVVAPMSNGRRAFLVDTLALVRRLESQGLTAKQAEAITAVIIEVLNDSLENVSHTFAQKADVQRMEMVADASLSKFKSELQSNAEHNFGALQREADRVRTDVEKMRSELRYEVDKVTAGQRLDLNLEKGRMREELANQHQETSDLTNKLDRHAFVVIAYFFGILCIFFLAALWEFEEINNLKTQLEAAKYDVIKYCIGTLVSVCAVGLGLLRVMM